MMAKVQIKRSKIETVNLTLSETEAKVLLTVFGSVTGDPKTTIRKYTDSIYDALRNSCDEFIDWSVSEAFELDSVECISLKEFYSNNLD
jgi:hypothetical protein